MDNNINDFIIKSFKYFDNKNDKYKKFIIDTFLDLDEKKIINEKTNNYLDIEFDTEILGIFDHENNIFVWSWAIPNLKIYETKITKELLYYGLNLDPTSNTISHYFLKTLLINARNKIDSDFDLDMILSISSYILKDKYNFIYPKNIYNKKNIVLTAYYLVKISNDN